MIPQIGDLIQTLDLSIFKNSSPGFQYIEVHIIKNVSNSISDTVYMHLDVI